MSEYDISIRLLLSFLFGAVVGIERQWHHKTAGLKTVTLVTVGSAAFGMVSVYGFGPNSTPTQVAASVVTGIGFIGAGVIIRRGGSIQGINTAATLWATSSMGLAIGAGHFGLAWRLFVLIIVAQFILRWIGNWIDRFSGMSLPETSVHVLLAFEPEAEGEVERAWSSFVNNSGVCVLRCSRSRPPGDQQRLEASLNLSGSRPEGLSAWIQSLNKITGMRRADWSSESAPPNDLWWQ
jgi:putative Mg2+ transporter-C (MgtC) family protein